MHAGLQIYLSLSALVKGRCINKAAKQGRWQPSLCLRRSDCCAKGWEAGGYNPNVCTSGHAIKKAFCSDTDLLFINTPTSISPAAWRHLGDTAVTDGAPRAHAARTASAALGLAPARVGAAQLAADGQWTGWEGCKKCHCLIMTVCQLGASVGEFSGILYQRELLSVKPDLNQK